MRTRPTQQPRRRRQRRLCRGDGGPPVSAASAGDHPPATRSAQLQSRDHTDGPVATDPAAPAATAARDHNTGVGHGSAHSSDKRGYCCTSRQCHGGSSSTGGGVSDSICGGEEEAPVSELWEILFDVDGS